MDALSIALESPATVTQPRSSSEADVARTLKEEVVSLRRENWQLKKRLELLLKGGTSPTIRRKALCSITWQNISLETRDKIEDILQREYRTSEYNYPEVLSNSVDVEQFRTTDFAKEEGYAGSVQYYVGFNHDLSRFPVQVDNTSIKCWDVSSYDRAIPDPLPLPEGQIDMRNRCWNCGSADHALAGCPAPRDDAKIKKNRAEFLAQTGSGTDDDRYFIAEEVNKFKPGVLSQRLKDALNMKEGELPPYYWSMEMHGYPPSYMEPVDMPPREPDGTQSSSGISVFHEETDFKPASLPKSPRSAWIEETLKGGQVMLEYKPIVEFPHLNIASPPIMPFPMNPWIYSITPQRAHMRSYGGYPERQSYSAPPIPRERSRIDQGTGSSSSNYNSYSRDYDDRDYYDRNRSYDERDYQDRGRDYRYRDRGRSTDRDSDRGRDKSRSSSRERRKRKRSPSREDEVQRQLFDSGSNKRSKTRDTPQPRMRESSQLSMTSSGDSSTTDACEQIRRRLLLAAQDNPKNEAIEPSVPVDDEVEMEQINDDVQSRVFVAPDSAAVRGERPPSPPRFDIAVEPARQQAIERFWHNLKGIIKETPLLPKAQPAPFNTPPSQPPTTRLADQQDMDTSD